jgi:hypothetical protein
LKKSITKKGLLEWFRVKALSSNSNTKKKKREREFWWLTPVILPSWEAEIRKIMVQGQPGQIVLETLSPK